MGEGAAASDPDSPVPFLVLCKLPEPAGRLETAWHREVADPFPRAVALDPAQRSALDPASVATGAGRKIRTLPASALAEAALLGVGLLGILLGVGGCSLHRLLAAELMRISGRGSLFAVAIPRRIYARHPPGAERAWGSEASVNRELCRLQLRLCPCLCEGAVKGMVGLSLETRR